MTIHPGLHEWRWWWRGHHCIAFRLCMGEVPLVATCAGHAWWAGCAEGPCTGQAGPRGGDFAGVSALRVVCRAIVVSGPPAPHNSRMRSSGSSRFVSSCPPLTKRCTSCSLRVPNWLISSDDASKSGSVLQTDATCLGHVPNEWWHRKQRQLQKLKAGIR